MLPPQPARRPTSLVAHGDTREDPYFWLRDRDDPEVIAHLEAENDFLVTMTADQAPLTERLYEEIRSRIEETDISVPVRDRGWWYYERTVEGLDYPISCRAPVEDPDRVPVIEPTGRLEGEQIVLDENVEAHGHDFCSIGVAAVSPSGEWLAAGVDHTGEERHSLTFRPLAGQEPPAETLEDLYYGFAWIDEEHVLYTRVDESMRPFQLWRHRLGTPPSDDQLLYEETDARFTVSCGRSRDDAVVLVVLNSSLTTEVRYLDTSRPTAELQILEARRHGIEYGVEHFTASDGRGWWLKVTNEGATDFTLLARPVDGELWRTVLAERPGCRLDDVEAFATHLVVAERDDGAAAVRVLPLRDAADPFGDDALERSWLVPAPDRPSTVISAANPSYDATSVRVVTTSLVTPRTVSDVVVASREVLERKRQIVRGGYDPSTFATGRLWVDASDGVRIPVSIVARADLVERDPQGDLAPLAPMPLLLYGYGSYEISIDPTFSSLRLSLLERGVAFAIAHVRGGGEMGRHWYEMGRLAQKPTTFSDFVAVARALVDGGWTDPAHLAARGGSAGGLLMGAAMNLAPELFRCVVAEVPFVDCLSTMLDSSLPLTVGEWEEWGNPEASSTAYRTMRSYSPYDNVRGVDERGGPVRYPDLLATGGLNDSRVGFWEPAKWVARLRDANPENLALLKTEMGAGHGGPSGRYDAWRDEAQVLAFILTEIGARVD